MGRQPGVIQGIHGLVVSVLASGIDTDTQNIEYLRDPCALDWMTSIGVSPEAAWSKARRESGLPWSPYVPFESCQRHVLEPEDVDGEDSPV